jgi:uncharacterized protein
MPALAAVRRLPARVVIFAIELYRTYVSPMRLPTCRFMPTCSQYAVDALTEYGLVKGSWLTAARLAKCGPWHRGGWDPLPERQNELRRGSDLAAPPASDEPVAMRTEDQADDGWDAPALRGESKSCV